MEKILGMSLSAILAVAPLMAMADDTPPSTTLNATSANALPSNGEGVIVAGEPYWAGKTITDTDRRTAASAAYVKGAYNDAIAAANKVHVEASGVAIQLGQVASSLADRGLSNLTSAGKANVSAQGTVDLTKADYDTNTVGKALVDIKTTADAAAGKADTAVQTVKVNSAPLTEDANGDVNIAITPGNTAGTINVNGSDVAVTGVLTSHQSLSDYATKTGVTNTISNSSASGSFDIVTDWTNETVNHITVNSTITGATYSEAGS